MEINVKEARGKFSAILHQVEEGAEIVLTRRGKEVARLMPPLKKAKRLPQLKDFRASLRISGKSLSENIVEGRREERY